ncbi:MAG: ErfK/YbiS/YcfS/YnhG [Gemmatimonadetes bacterium]|nr:ErfK/YbiS/YcfS/YnhG [Gemmatimonadota bacterium]
MALSFSGAATTPSIGPGPGPVGIADSIVIEKQKHRLTLYHMGRALRSYRVALGASPSLDKVMRGDRRTPEGVFSIEARNPNSQFHLSLRISYPSARHREVAAKLGVDPGGDIMIHGLPNGRRKVGKFHLTRDWTNGCVALTDEEMEEIWNAVPVGTPVEIKA